MNKALLTVLLFLSACNRGNSTLIICGGASNFQCPNDMYCQLGDHCGGIDKEGTCMPRPETCPLEKGEVCGCDRKTYDSACWAAALGMTILHDGSCNEHS